MFLYLASCSALVVPARPARTRVCATTVEMPVVTDATALEKRFERAVDLCLRNETDAELLSLLDPGARWSMPLGETEGVDGILELLHETRDFYERLRFEVYESEGDVLKWVLSGTWPTPWRPRAVVYGTSKIEAQGTITSITDAWEPNPAKLFFSQIWPKFWDLWDLYMTPPAERPVEVPITAGLPMFSKFRVVKVMPYTALRASLVDLTNSRSMRMASALPIFPFAAPYVSHLRNAMSATSPIETSIDIINRDPVERRITWEIPVATPFRDLPSLEAGESQYVDEGWGRDPTIEYVHRPEEYYLLTDYLGDPQDKESEQLRRELVAAAAKHGLEPIQQQPTAIHRQFNSKVVFNTRGEVCLAAYLPRQWNIPFDKNQMAIRIHPPR